MTSTAIEMTGLYGLRGRRIADRVTATLEAVQLADRRAELVGALSKGLR